MTKKTDVSKSKSSKQPTNSTPTKLSVVRESKQTLDLKTLIQCLEECGGNIDQFLEENAIIPADLLLFKIHQELALPVNEGLKERWEAALDASAALRLDRLRCKAFKILEDGCLPGATHKATDITFAKAILAKFLLEDSEEVKAKYRPVQVAEGVSAEDMELDELDKELSG